MSAAVIADEAGRCAAVLIVLLLPLGRLAVGRRGRPWPSFFTSSRKEPLMSDLPNASAVPDAAPIATAPAVVTADAPAPAIDPNKVVTSVVQAVQSHPDVPAPKAASVIASILSGLFTAQPALFAVTRASPQTQAEVSLGLGLAEVIVGAFLHPTS